MNRHFDYQIWKSEEGEYYARVRRTGQVTQIPKEICRFLRSEERREARMAHPRNGHGRERPVSLDAPVPGTEGLLTLSDLLSDPVNPVEQAEIRMDLERFEAGLPPVQRSVFHALYREQQIPAQYAASRGIARQTVCEHRDAIAKKAREYFSEP
ncbi:MAG: hypothetical protein J6P31_05440 [Oscillospiraceae bacterium]|nr:hypothetical protein [Oscillospiraceae bacterium]